MRKLAAALLFVLGTTAVAQEYPAKPVTMIVPFPPGGVADTVARPVAEAMARALKQSVVVENRSGAGGGIGMGAAAKAAPDGYTVLLALSSISIIPEADKLLQRSPMYELKQLEPIARFTADPTVLTVRADSPWKTAVEFIAAMKAKPAAYSYGSSGNYGTMHVPMEMLKKAAGFRLLHIPYTGAGPAAIVQHVRSGKLRPLAHWGEGRLASLPDVPSLTELGYRVGFSQWSGLFVPADTPAPIVARLRDAARTAANDAKVQQVISGAGSPVLYLDAPEFRQFWDQDAKKMVEAVRAIGRID